MITVNLKSGKSIDILDGKSGNYENTTKTRYVEDVIVTNLIIKDGPGYDAKTIASFKADEVIGYTYTDDTAEETDF